MDAGAVPLLVLSVQEPEMALKRIAASTLSDIAKHTPELAHTVVDAGAIAHLAQMILNPDAKLKARPPIPLPCHLDYQFPFLNMTDARPFST